MEGKDNTPETSKLKSKNRKYSEAVLKSAIESVLKSRLTVYGASKEYNVPWSTLKVNVERVKQERELGETQIKMLKVGRPFSLSVNLEQSLLSYIVQMQEIGFGLTVNQIRQLAFTLADNSDSKHYFNANKRHAGWNWWVGFKERYGLSLRSPENLSAGRAICSNAAVLADFYEKLQTTLASHDLTDCPERIWNCDETGLIYVNKPNKIVTKIGKKYVYNRTYAEKGTTTTVLACINAAGQFIPPLVIFKGVRNTPELCRGAFPNSLTRLSPKGWINADLFYEWLQFFNDNIPPVRPVLLIMDSHASHITPRVLAYAKSHQIILFTMPAHTSHLLQPLDVGVFKSLKTVWRAELQDYKVKNPSKVPTRLDFHTFLTPVYEKCFTPSNIRSGFRKAGIFPLNKEVICPEAIAPSTLSDQMQVVPEVVNLKAHYDIEIARSEIHKTDIDPFKETEVAEIVSPLEIESPIPCTSFSNQPHPIEVAPSDILQMECESEQITETNNLASSSPSNLQKILINDILVLPKWKPSNKTRQNRTVPKAQCLTPIVSTSSTDLTDAKLTNTKLTDTKPTITKEKSLSYQKSASGSQKRNRKSVVKQTSKISKPLKTSSTDEDWFCSICNGWYSHDVKMKNGADWITCSFCTHPYHTHCQNQDVNDDQHVFMYDNCSFDNSSGEE